MKKFFAWILSFFNRRRRSDIVRTDSDGAPTFNFADVLPIVKLRLGDMIRITPGKHHAWFASNLGPVRKRIPCAHDVPCLSRV